MSTTDRDHRAQIWGPWQVKEHIDPSRDVAGWKAVNYSTCQSGPLCRSKQQASDMADRWNLLLSGMEDGTTNDTHRKPREWKLFNMHTTDEFLQTNILPPLEGRALWRKRKENVQSFAGWLWRGMERSDRFFWAFVALCLLGFLAQVWRGYGPVGR